MTGKSKVPENGRPVWAEISLGALARNLRAIQRWVGAKRQILAVVKADAYGHGAPAVARALERAGAATFGVTSVSEGAELREAGVRRPILIMTGWWKGEEKHLLEYRLTPAVHGVADLKPLERAAAAYARRLHRPRFRLPFHLKVDTGMNRLGISPGEVHEFVRVLADCPHLELAATFTHFASSEDFRTDQTEEQEKVFAEAVARLRQTGVNPGLLHLANSAAIATRPSSWGDMVRPGAMLYGYHQNYAPADQRQVAERNVRLDPALSLRARIIALRDVPAGAGIGYNATFTTSRPSRVAVIPAGYADGLVRRLSGRGKVLVRGMVAPLVGAISMDLSIVDVSDIPGVQAGDVVTIFGADGSARMCPSCVAREIGTVTSDLLCSLGKRVPRHYLA
jgi:alanine racemase